MIITIDGPIASGKSTIARLLAKHFNYYYIYSGILYRALAYLLINEAGYTENMLRDPKREDIVRYLDPKFFQYVYDDQFQERVFFDKEDITPRLKSSFIDKMTSILSVNKQVRDALMQVQRKLAQQHSVVVDGRDAGSIVFPHADFKFFLTASVSVRATRWKNQQAKIGCLFSREQASKIISERDNRDATRAIAPMIIPDRAIIVDNSDLNVQETLQKMIYYLNQA